MNSKPRATLSLDLDNLWSYLRTRGDPDWSIYPTYLELAIPRILDLFKSLGQRITIFVVGRDIELSAHRDLFLELATSGHEIGNHSYNHTIDFHRATRSAVVDEFEQTERALEALSGIRTRGFRGPSFRLSDTILQVLAERGYLYDASTFPTFFGPFARAYVMATSLPGSSERDRAKDLFGSVRDGFGRLQPYEWVCGNDTVLEIPVTTFPILRSPVHFTYFNYIADRSPSLANAYVLAALKACQLGGLTPSLLLHATDFIGVDDPNCPHFLPGMRRTSGEKIAALGTILADLIATFDVSPLEDFALELLKSNRHKKHVNSL